ncbi:hypothetical protein GWK47_043767 [Chionoecetes opilio]|uniref:Uncharacterized protein n=1 Tax=Chionoecetes opilio TaxID=41210 RepID=A0A8J4YHB1_CHIOP|nr:hypothetical protein GWK47_043767 [Chionoecetes opilio]
MGLHNLEEELALFLVFGQPEVEGLDERHSSLGCVVDDGKSLDSAAGLDVRFLFLPLPRVGGQEVGLDIKSFEEGEREFFRGEGGTVLPLELVMMGGLSLGDSRAAPFIFRRMACTLCTIACLSETGNVSRTVTGQ